MKHAVVCSAGLAGLLVLASPHAAAKDRLHVVEPAIQTCYAASGSAPGDDLLTGGLGRSGLAGAAPGFADALNPTAAELRRRAIHTNYRAVLDITAGGGYGSFYGPNLDRNGIDTGSEGKIAGCETLAYLDDGSGSMNVTLMVQVPDGFDANNPCIVTATSSGSRGIYGAIGSAGEWGLKNGCAVAYTDAGKGNGLHDLMSHRVGRIDGTRAAAEWLGVASHFTAPLSDAARLAYNAAWPDRVAYKHAHSQRNPEKDWGAHTLEAVKFAFRVLNEQFAKGGGGRKFRLDRPALFNPGNTLVIASSISNGATAALQAAEQDNEELVDGVAVAEPNAQPGSLDGLRLRQGAAEFPLAGKGLYDYFTYANLYQPCAALAPAAAGAPALAFLSAAAAASRCAGLSAKGLVGGTDLASQAADALARLHAYGWLADSDALHASHYRFATNAIAVTYANAHGRFGVADNLCGFSFANTTAAGAPTAQNAATQASLFATGNGVPPTSGVNIVYNLSAAGPALDLLAVSPSTGSADFALDGALCHRALATGSDPVSGAALGGEMQQASARVRQGMREVELSGRLRGKPAIIVHGRSDALVPVNHASRAYYAKNRRLEGHQSANVSYVEVTHAQHFDAFLPGGPVFGGYENRYLPLHVYFIRAMDALYRHLRHGAALPPSQLVRTLPRGGTPGSAPALGAANVPPIAAQPAAADRILFQADTLTVPD